MAYTSKSYLDTLYQPLDADLTTIAGLTATTDNFLVSVASAWASRTPSQVRTTLGLVIGTNVQAYDADLTTWAGLTPTTVGQNLVTLTNPSAVTFPRINADNTITARTAAELLGDIGAQASGSYQPLDSDLTTIAGLTATTDNFIVSVASAWASRTPSQVRTTLGLVIGTDVQAYDADLTTWAGITPGSNVGSALATNVGSAGAFVVNGGVLGTPSSGTVTNLTGTASININGTVGAGTPAAGTFTLLTASKAGLSLDVANTTDGVSNQVVKFSGVNATRANNDLIYQSYFLANSTGTQKEFVRLNFKAPVVTNTSEDGSFIVSLMTAGTLTNKLLLTKTDMNPVTSDDLSLGTGSLMWSDLFLASGSVINFNNGDVTVTHSTNTLTFAGASSGYLYDAMNAPSTNDAAALGSGTLMWSDLFLASGGVINFNNGNVTLTHAAGALTSNVSLTAPSFIPNSSTVPSNGVYLPAANTLGFAVNSGGEVQITGTAMSPIASDGNALGTTALMWSDLFLAAGGVANFNNGSVTLTESTNTLTLGGSGANGNKLTLAAGGTSLASLNIPAGTLTTTAVDGDIEMDANAFYACTDAGNRGVIPVEHIIRQHANRANFANNTNQQAIFDSVTNGTLTLETGAYLFEAHIQIQGTSATSGNLKFSLVGAGGGTFTIILYTIIAIDAANDTNTAPTMTTEVVSTQVATNMATATTATVTTFLIKGSFECTGAGTLIPSVAQTTGVNNSANTLAGSYFRCNRIGASTAVSVGQWT